MTFHTNFHALGLSLHEAGPMAKVGRTYLHARGWGSAAIKEANFRWLNPSEVLGRWKNADKDSRDKSPLGVTVVGALLLPYPGVNDYGVARLFLDGEIPTGKKERKFLTPTGLGLRPYIPDGVSRSAKTKLILVESPFKAAIANSKGVRCIGINGCTGCHEPKAHLSAQPSKAAASAWLREDLRQYFTPRRRVMFLTDADCETNPAVGQNQLDLLDCAAAIGCKPEYRPLPAGGLDDFLVSHTAEDFRALKTFPYTSQRVAKLRQFVKAGGAAYGLAESDESVADLLTREMKPIEYLFDGLLARGATSLLAGPPKGFKSTFALWLGLVAVGAVPSGWSQFKPVGGGKLRVGYLDLEQAPGLFVLRLKQFHPNSNAVKRMRRNDRQFKLDAPGLAELAKYIKGHALDLLIIDTLARVRSHERGSNASQQDADLLAPVTRLAHETGCHIMLVTHTGKRKDYDNPVDMIGATSQLAAAVDDILILYRPQGAERETQRHLYVSGRHIEASGNYLIERTPDGFDFIGEASEVVEGKAQKEVAAVLRDQLKQGATPKQIGDALGKTGHAVSKLLPKLMKGGVIGALGDGRYQFLANIKRGAA